MCPSETAHPKWQFSIYGKLCALAPMQALAHHIPMAALDLQIDKMHCGACVRRVTQTLNAVPQTHANSVQIGAARVVTQTAPEQVLQALEAAGFPARVTSTQP